MPSVTMMTFEPQALNLGDEPPTIPPEILKAAATVARAELEGMLLYTPRFEALAEAILRAAFSAAAVAQAGPPQSPSPALLGDAEAG